MVKSKALSNDKKKGKISSGFQKKKQNTFVFSFSKFFKDFCVILSNILSSKRNRAFITFFLILGIMFVGYYVRSGPISLKGIDDIARQNVLSNIKLSIKNEIDAKYPNLNDYYKGELIEKEFKKVLDSGVYKNVSINIYIDEFSSRFKAMFQAENGQTYLNAIDPYHYLKYADIYDENGYIGTSLKNGEPWIDYKLAPTGTPGKWKRSFHVFIESVFYKIYGVDYKSSDGEKMRAIYLIPVIFVILSVIPIFFILREYFNDLSAFFGSLFLMCIGTYVSRTIAGFVDTDAYNVFFPLLIVMFVVLAIFEVSSVKKYLFYGLAALTQLVYLLAWGPGWFMFIFVFGSLLSLLGYKVLYYLIKEFNQSSKFDFIDFINEVYNNCSYLINGIVVFLILIFICGYFFIQQNFFVYVYSGFSSAISSIGAIETNNIWPNVLSSVAELNPASLGQIMGSIGGKFVFALGLLGLFFLSFDFSSGNEKVRLLKKINLFFAFLWFFIVLNFSVFVSLTSNFKLLYLFLLILPILMNLFLSLFGEVDFKKIYFLFIILIWFVGTVYMAFRGIRFILLFAPAFSIMLGIFFYYIYKYIRDFIDSGFNMKSVCVGKVIATVLVVVLFVFIFKSQFLGAVDISKRTFPNFDDNWFNAMYKIKNESQPDAIITSWWDFGHFFAAISDRGVTFDGGSQTTPRAHWVGRLFLESNENVSVDILRMLVCGGNEAFNKFYSFVGKDDSDAVKIIRILNKSFGKKNKRDILVNNGYYNLSDKQIDEILEYLDCKNPHEDFVITSGDMIGKAGVWAHWGSWNFVKKYIYDHYKSMSPEEIAKKIDIDVSLAEKYVKELKEINVRAIRENKNLESQINLWFAPYPSYIPIQGNYNSHCVLKGSNRLVCDNSLVIDTKSGKIVSSRLNPEIVQFRNLYFPINQSYIEVVTQNKSGNTDVVIIPDRSGLSVVLMQAPLGDSLFTKLFFFNGKGTKHFNLFDKFRSAVGFDVSIWKVKFNLNESLNGSRVMNVSNNVTDPSS